MIEPIQITAPTRAGVELYELKDHLRITHDDEDTLLEGYIEAATAHFQRRTGRTVYETEWEIAYDSFIAPRIKLQRGYPLISVTSIKYVDSEGSINTLSPSLYAVDTYNGRVSPAYGQSWPSFTAYPMSAVRIRYRAGIADSLSPRIYTEAGIRQCICEMVGSMYENRESVVVTDRASVAAFAENPFSRAMIQNYTVAYAY